MAKNGSVERKALELLRSPDFFPRLLNDLRRLGLVGESRNAAVLFIVAISSLLNRPLNALVKGASAAGKNFLVGLVLRLLPGSAVREITNASKTAWNYGEDSFRNKVVYLQERNDSTGSVHPIRLLISEGKLIRTVTSFENGVRVANTFVANGPISSISTTTRDRIEVDDETRHISLWMNESAAQTRRVNRGCIENREALSAHEIAVWHCAYGLIEQEAEGTVAIPDWFHIVAEKVNSAVITSRRYFPALVEACKTIWLLRSFQDHSTNPGKRELSFEDYAIATILLEKIFVESLGRSDDDNSSTRDAVLQISTNKAGMGVDARELADFLSISEDRAYRMLRDALAAGAIRRANSPSKTNLKLFVATDLPRFLPEPSEILADIPEITRPVEFIHPLTGEPLVLQRNKQR